MYVLKLHVSCRLLSLVCATLYVHIHVHRFEAPRVDSSSYIARAYGHATTAGHDMSSPPLRSNRLRENAETTIYRVGDLDLLPGRRRGGVPVTGRRYNTSSNRKEVHQ